MSIGIRGSIVALVTPMHRDGSLDLVAFDRLVDWHVESGTAAIVVVGTTGESATLTVQEHCDLVSHCVQACDRRIPVIAGTGSNSTAEALFFTESAREHGADACLLVTPYYNKPTQEGLYLHYKAVAEAVDIPQILYNVPGRTACDMLPETVARLASVENISGIKEATGDLGRVHQIRELCGEDFPMYSGDDETACEFCLQGGVGVISVTANVAPALMHKMCKAAIAGDRQVAEEYDSCIAGLHKQLFVESNPIPAKWAVHEMGLIERGIRLPLTWLQDDFRQLVRDAMDQAGV